MALTAYFTLRGLQNRLSVEGVNLRVDDKPETWIAVRDNTSTIIDEYLRLRYDPVQLAQSDWVRERALDIGTCLLCKRRGNPVPIGIASQCERAEERLEMVRLGQLEIPDIGARKEDVPVLSNVRSRLTPWPRTVVEPSRSTGTPEGYNQRADQWDWLDYSI